MILGVPLRWNPCEAHAIVERQALSNLPRILAIELQLIVAEVSDRTRAGLGKVGEVPHQRTGICHPAIIGTAGRICRSSTIIETELTVGISPGDLVLSIALVKYPKF